MSIKDEFDFVKRLKKDKMEQSDLDALGQTPSFQFIVYVLHKYLTQNKQSGLQSINMELSAEDSNYNMIFCIPEAAQPWQQVSELTKFNLLILDKILDLQIDILDNDSVSDADKKTMRVLDELVDFIKANEPEHLRRKRESGEDWINKL